MLASAKRGDGGRRMKMIRQTNAHRIELFVSDEVLGLAIFAGYPKLPHHFLPSFRNKIRDGGQLESPGIEIALCVGGSRPAAADDAHANLLAHFSHSFALFASLASYTEGAVDCKTGANNGPKIWL
jgi:hypothetical protein